MKNKPLNICDAQVFPGEIANLALPLPEQYSCAPLYMPIKVINGKNAGPCLVIFSVLKGTELNGLEIANRTVAAIQPQHLSGTLIAIPVMNVYGLTHYPTSLPTMEANLARCFPGDETGSYGQRMAHLITQEILTKAHYCIELQTGGINHNILPQVYCNIADPKARALAQVFRSPVITNVTMDDNPLRQTTESLQVPLLVYEAGEALRFDENAINLGVDGLHNVMRAIDMLKREPSRDVTPIFSKEEDWILAHKAGILHSNITLGQTIDRKEAIASISDPFGADRDVPVHSPLKGIVVGMNTSPLIHEGMPIFKVASFIDYQRAETAIEAWDKIQPDSYIGRGDE